MIEISIFKAYDGDCIWIRYGLDNKTNIIIDVGYLKGFKSILLPIFNICLDRNENIDLLVITHTDRDHISGMKGFRKQKELLKLVKKAWFNHPYILDGSCETDKISFNEGESVFQLFEENNIQVREKVHNGIEDYSLNDAKFIILSPRLEDLSEYNSDWIDNVNTDKVFGVVNDWNNSIHELATNQNSMDDSKSNLTSISFLFEFDSKRILFLGDANPETIVEKLIGLGFAKTNPIQIDCVKLAHHGSKYSISDELVSIINCNQYLVSSNGTNLSKQTLSKLVMHNQEKYKRHVEFYFNYSSDIYAGLFSNDEIEEFNIKCHFAEEENNYINLRF